MRGPVVKARRGLNDIQKISKKVAKIEGAAFTDDEYDICSRVFVSRAREPMAGRRRCSMLETESEDNSRKEQPRKLNRQLEQIPGAKDA